MGVAVRSRVPRSGADHFSSVSFLSVLFLSVLSSWIIWWCVFLLVRKFWMDLRGLTRPDKQKGRGSRISGSAALEGACWLVA